MSVMLTHVSMVEFAKTRIMITRAIAFRAQAGEEKTVRRILAGENGLSGQIVHMCAKKMELKKIQKEHKRDPEIATLQVVLEMKRKPGNAPAIVVFAKTKLENRNVTRKRKTARRTGNFATLVVRRHVEHANETLHLQHPEFPTK